MAAHEQISADAATQHVRIHRAARRLYQLWPVLDTDGPTTDPTAVARRRVRRSERRAHRALTRAGFTDPVIAAAVLRQAQVLTSTTSLAKLTYGTPYATENLPSSPTAAPAKPDEQEPSHRENTDDTGNRDAQLITAAARIAATASQNGSSLSQAALASKLRAEGYTVANSRLRWLSATISLDTHHPAESTKRPRESR